jgi:hypothetical protein
MKAITITKRNDNDIEIVKIPNFLPKDTIKVVINACYGGFGLSKEAFEYLGLDYNEDWDVFRDDRANPKLVEVVESLGAQARGDYAKLKIVEIPADVEWFIQENYGKERVAEKHRTWS